MARPGEFDPVAPPAEIGNAVAEGYCDAEPVRLDAPTLAALGPSCRRDNCDGAGGGREIDAADPCVLGSCPF